MKKSLKNAFRIHGASGPRVGGRGTRWVIPNEDGVLIVAGHQNFFTKDTYEDPGYTAENPPKGIAIANLKELYRELHVGRKVVILECVMKSDHNPSEFDSVTGNSWYAEVSEIGVRGHFTCRLISQSSYLRYLSR